MTSFTTLTATSALDFAGRDAPAAQGWDAPAARRVRIVPAVASFCISAVLLSAVVVGLTTPSHAQPQPIAKAGTEAAPQA